MYWTNASQRLKEVAGPLLLERLTADYPDVKLLEPWAFFPSTPEERERAVAVHHMARVWHNTTTLRAAMLRAEKRLERTKARLDEERRAHAATKKRLAKLEEGLGKRGKEPRAAKRDRREKRAWLRPRD
jgi:hypothetical protein